MSEFETLPRDAAKLPIYGIDGLYWYDGHVVGIRNGVQPWRLPRMELDVDDRRIGRTVIMTADRDAYRRNGDESARP